LSPASELDFYIKVIYNFFRPLAGNMYHFTTKERLFMSNGKGKNTAEKQGEGDLSKKQRAPKEVQPACEVIPEQACVMVACNEKTSTPYSKLHDGRFVCCKKCNEAYYAIPNPLGVWGTPDSPLIRRSDDQGSEPNRRRAIPPQLYVVP
jgi:hypothetical protein